MEGFLTIVVLVGGIVAYYHFRTNSQHQLVAGHTSGRILHLRTGDYPASCSWCKNTTLAKKLLVFERENGNWKSADLIRQLEACPPPDVERVSSVFTTDQARWRKFCTEKCAKDFFVAEHVTTIEAFTACGYCSSRSPAALIRCPSCGAAR